MTKFLLFLDAGIESAFKLMTTGGTGDFLTVVLTTGLILSLVLSISRSDFGHVANEGTFTRFPLNLNVGRLLLSSYKFLQLRNIDPFVVKKYLSIVGNEVD